MDLTPPSGSNPSSSNASCSTTGFLSQLFLSNDCSGKSIYDVSHKWEQCEVYSTNPDSYMYITYSNNTTPHPDPPSPDPKPKKPDNANSLIYSAVAGVTIAVLATQFWEVTILEERKKDWD